jgi:hypothetical protein
MASTDDIPNFDAIESEGLAADKLLSNIYNVKIGGFGQPDSIRTYLATLSVRDLEQDIDFYETLSKDKSWPVSQIIQREVDKIRVSTISKDYVLGEGRDIKYFPPIIIAILPRNSEGKIDLKLDYNPDNSENIKELIYAKSNYRTNASLKNLFLKAPNVSPIAGLYLLEVFKVMDFNIFCWDKNQYYAVVIDGQHRLDSLLKSKNDNPDIENYIQDVVFLDFSILIKNVGERFSPVEVVRRVFIDINTNAKRVGVVRQILMDDKDLSSLLVQSLVDSVNKDGSSKESSKFLISQIVDWYGDSLKHSFPHLTGVLSLYQILSDYLVLYNLSSINDLRNPTKVKNWVKRQNEYFFVDDSITNNPKWADVTKLSESLNNFNRNRDIYEELADGLEDDFKESELFQYDYRALLIAQENFENLYLKGFVYFFNEFTPYKDAMSVLVENQAFEPDSVLNQTLLSSRNKIAKSPRLREAFGRIKEKLEAQLSNRFYLLYSVLGQKAIFNLLFKRIFTEFNKDFTEAKCLELVDSFLQDINSLVDITISGEFGIFGKKENMILTDLDDALIDLGTIATSFWDGIIYEDNKIIYNSQGIQSLSSFIEYAILIKKNHLSGLIPVIPFDISFLKGRIKRILKRRFDIPNDEDLNMYANQIIAKKKEFIDNIIVGNLI